jgi:formate hydrogenlyase subunit 6/NADH:ubiquinone oxidoreductase subunit I
MTLGETATKCIACGICAKACPMELLSVVEK